MLVARRRIQSDLSPVYRRPDFDVTFFASSIRTPRAFDYNPPCNMPERITILGDGAMATVCSILLTTGGHSVTLWGAFEQSIEALLQDREQHKLLPGVKIPPQVRLTANDADCFDGATLILSAIPTQYTRSAWERLKPHVPAGVPIVSVAKGIENTTLLRPTQIIGDVLYAGVGTESSGLCALSGPNIAGELVRRSGAGRARPGGVFNSVVARLHQCRRDRRGTGGGDQKRDRDRRRNPRRAGRRQ
jgi:hypothetical protein